MLGEREKSGTIVHAGRYLGVRIVSRWNKREEVHRMMRACECLRATERWALTSTDEVFCDSKAEACYTVALKVFREQWLAYMTGSVWAECFKRPECGGGHNGLTVVCGDDVLADIEPWWPDGWFPA